jgi:hypothetical protein
VKSELQDLGAKIHSGLIDDSSFSIFPGFLFVAYLYWKINAVHHNMKQIFFIKIVKVSIVF